MNFRSIVKLYAEKYGVPASMAMAIAQRESGIQQWRSDGTVVTGTSGELGIMQLMPSTAAQLGVDPRDPEQNIRGGLRYLADMYRQFGSWYLAAAAYNWGPGYVRDYLNGKRKLPASVAQYARAVTGEQFPADVSRPGVTYAHQTTTPAVVETPITGSSSGLVWGAIGVCAVVVAWAWS